MDTLVWTRIEPRGYHLHAMGTRFTPRSPMIAHGHDYAEILLVTSGRGTHTLNGGRYPVRAGDCFVIRPGDAHEMGVERDELSIVNVAFPAGVWRSLGRRYGGQCPELFRSRPGLAHFDAETTRAMGARMLALADGPRDRLAIDRFVLSVTAHWPGVVAPARFGEPRCPDWLQHALNQIVEPEHFRNGTAGFVRLARRSPEHTARCLRRLTGRTISQVVNDARLDYAAAELRLTGRPILEIVDNCGFSGPARFYELFTRRFGTSPRRYRVHHQRVTPRRPASG